MKKSILGLTVCLPLFFQMLFVIQDFIQNNHGEVEAGDDLPDLETLIEKYP